MNIRDMHINKKYLAGIIISALLFFIFLPKLVSMTDTTVFCSSCHVMSAEYEDWFYSGMHRQIKCVDCHLPNDGVINHYMWKGIDGLKDVVYFYTGIVAEEIHSTKHAKKAIKENCVRCHEEMVSRISTDNLKCWECHRSAYHNRSGEF
jgi:cytochrome c nitrite reductase small subunit